ncbi:Oligosaccaryltransferase-domain-containing protein [Kalaharituber pfeilii]|nr:Oligosaccaryltransferase-domain-containing protein [Kalaharituber pfeilii]
MITDAQLNALALFLGTFMMSLIVLYHFLAVNAEDASKSDSQTPGEGQKHKAAIVGTN